MKSPSQTNAIDFDSAKLQRLGFGQQPPILERPVNLAQLRQQLNLQLQTSLEPQRILGLFYREIQRLVPLDALSYQHKSSDLRLEFGQRGHHSISYSLSHEGEHMGEVVFRRNHRFCGQYYNTYTDANTPAFIRTVHADNDSDPHASGKIERADWDSAAPLIAQHFPFDAAMLQRL